VERNRSMEKVFGTTYGMDRTMAFIPELQDYLRKRGFIFTVRKYKMTDAYVMVKGVGKCHRIPLGEVKSRLDLVPFGWKSGFDTIDDWWDKIRQFIPDTTVPMYLYSVTKEAQE